MHAHRPGSPAPQDLRESGELFRSFVENVTDDALITLSPSGEIVTWNKSSSGEIVAWNKGAERIKGDSAAEIVGRHFSLFFGLFSGAADLDIASPVEAVERDSLPPS